MFATRKDAAVQERFGVSPRHSLRRRLMIPLATILLVALLLFEVSVLLIVAQIENDAWRGRQGEAARAEARAVNETVQQALDTLVYLTQLDTRQLNAEPGLMQSVIGPQPNLLEALRLDGAGNVVASAYQDRQVLADQFTLPLSRWYQQARAGERYFGKVQITANNKPYVTIALPAADGGVLAARMGMDVLWHAVADVRFGDSGRVYVIDRDGRVIAHTDAVVAADNTSIVGRPEYRSMLQTPGQEWSGQYVNFEQKAVVGVSTPIKAAGWILIAELPRDEAYAATRSALVMTNAIMLLLLVLTMWVVRAFLRNSVLQPIDQLKIGMERIREGDLEHRIGLRRRDELGLVANGFDQMAESLGERGRQLAAKVAEQMQTALALGQSEARYRAIIEDQTELICRFRADGTLLFVNGAYCRYFGKRREELIGHTFMPLIPAEDRKIVEEQGASLSVEKPVTNYQHRVLGDDDDVRWMEWTDRAFFDQQGTLVEFQSVGRDITESRLAEAKINQLNADLERRVLERTQELAATNADLQHEVVERRAVEASLNASEERLRLALQAASAGAWEWNMVTNRTVWSAENYRVMGMVPDSIEPHFDNWLRCIHADDRPMANEAIARSVEQGSSLNIEFRVIFPDGSSRWINDLGHVIFDQAGRPTGMYGIQMDITERKRAEERIRASLTEKEILLKEIHHRVKNNLQIISSLLNLQSGSIDDAGALAKFQDSQSRIRSMALIHESLYRSNDLEHIDFGAYLQDLAASLVTTYRRQGQGVTLEVKAEPVLLDIDTAIPCGLIVNELVSNALKYAFPNGRSGQIGVEIGRTDGTTGYRLVVWDDGVGMPAGMNVQSAQTLGLQLVNSLAQQIDGTVECQPYPGTKIIVGFPEPNNGSNGG